MLPPSSLKNDDSFYIRAQDFHEKSYNMVDCLRSASQKNNELIETTEEIWRESSQVKGNLREKIRNEIQSRPRRNLLL